VENVDVSRNGMEYTMEEMILLSKIAKHKRSPYGMISDFAANYQRSLKAVTQQVNYLRKMKQYQFYLNAEEKLMAV